MEKELIAKCKMKSLYKVKKKKKKYVSFFYCTQLSLMCIEVYIGVVGGSMKLSVLHCLIPKQSVQ